LNEAATGIDMTAVAEIAHNVRFAGSLADTPPNELHVTSYVELVKKIHAEKLAAKGVTLEIIQGKELAEKGCVFIRKQKKLLESLYGKLPNNSFCTFISYGAIWGVGKAAEHLPALVILSYQPQGATKTVAWVGKGIVYDTGGLSLKGPLNMVTMKNDMGGSAGVFGGFVAAVVTDAAKNVNLHAVLCLAENSVSERSTRPDDVLTSYSGKTVSFVLHF
jgi:probable aminopeptidase NPEPL1